VLELLADLEDRLMSWGPDGPLASSEPLAPEASTPGIVSESPREPGSAGPADAPAASASPEART
jgi:hypothetical protein